MRLVRLAVSSSFLLSSFACFGAINLDHTYQHFAASNQEELDTQILSFGSDFYLVKDINYQSRFDLDYQWDLYKEQDEEAVSGLEALEDGSSHSVSATWTQGLTATTKLGVSGGASFASGGDSFNIGGSLEQALFEDNTYLSVGYNRSQGDKESELIIARDLRAIDTASEYSANDYSFSLTQTFTSSTVGRFSWNYSQATEEADSQVLSVRVHQWLPSKTALQLEYSYFSSIGDIPNESEVGGLQAHILDVLVKQYVTRKTILSLGYRFYREDETVESNFREILGSDLFSFGVQQEVANILGLEKIESLKLEAFLRRYLSNRESSAWIGSLSTSFLF